MRSHHNQKIKLCKNIGFRHVFLNITKQNGAKKTDLVKQRFNEKTILVKQRVGERQFQ